MTRFFVTVALIVGGLFAAAQTQLHFPPEAAPYFTYGYGVFVGWLLWGSLFQSEGERLARQSLELWRSALPVHWARVPEHLCQRRPGELDVSTRSLATCPRCLAWKERD